MTTTFEVLPEHGYVIISIIVIAFHCFLESFKVAKIRYSLFTEEYIKNHLAAESEELKKGLGEEIKPGCHPDNGLGRFSAHLSTVDWVRFQSAQRAHLNYLETLTFSLFAIFFAGVFYPLTASILAAFHLLGRIMFGIGFRTRPSLRGRGFGIVFLTNIINAGIAIYGSLRLTGLINF